MKPGREQAAGHLADADAQLAVGRPGADRIRAALLAAADGVPVDVDALPQAVRDALSEAMGERDAQAQLDLELCCPNCGVPFTALFDTASFFLTELEQRASRLLLDVHTLASQYHWSEAEILSMPPRRREKYLALLQGRPPRSVQ